MADNKPDYARPDLGGVVVLLPPDWGAAGREVGRAYRGNDFSDTFRTADRSDENQMLLCRDRERKISRMTTCFGNAVSAGNVSSREYSVIEWR